MGIYDRDYMKRPEDRNRRSSSSSSSLSEKLESLSQSLFTRHRKVMVGIIVGIIALTIIAFAVAKMT